MRGSLLIAAVLAVGAAPSLASAATRCEQENANHEVAGTVLGAIAGGLVGNAVSHGGGKAGGTAIGVVGGAVIGNRLAAGANGACPEGYRAYDDGDPGYDRNDYARPADAYGRDSSAYGAYPYDQPRDQYDGRSGATWQDQSGRTCHWRYEGRDAVKESWGQDCR
jgi:hypothetical protein